MTFAKRWLFAFTVVFFLLVNGAVESTDVKL